MVFLTFAAEFNAVNRLWSPELDEAENVRVYAECANPAGHGHLYRVEVTLAADVDMSRPNVIDRGAITRLIETVLAPTLANANMDTTFGIDRFISTGENVTKAIWDLVGPHVPEHTTLVAVRVVETPKNSFVYYGAGGPQRSALPMT